MFLVCAPHGLGTRLGGEDSTNDMDEIHPFVVISLPLASRVDFELLARFITYVFHCWELVRHELYFDQSIKVLKERIYGNLHVIYPRQFLESGLSLLFLSMPIRRIYHPF